MSLSRTPADSSSIRPGEAALGFWQQAEQRPDRVAVIDPDGAAITYEELASLVNRLAHGLREAGAARGTTVALAIKNHHAFFAVALACEQIGVHLVPINWHLTPPEIAYMLTNSEAVLAIAGPTLEQPMTRALDLAGVGPGARFAVAATPGFRPLSDLVTGQPATEPAARVAGTPMVYTSGTTGRPKGVRRPIVDILPEQFLAMLAPMFAQRGFTPGDGVYFGPAPLYHAAPCIHAMFALHCGFTVVLMEGWESAEALDLVVRHRATHTHVAPIHLQRWLGLAEDVRMEADVSALRWVIHAGAPCPVDVKHRVIEWLGPVLFEYYAGSEGTFTSVTSEEWLAHPGTVGNVSLSPSAIKVLDDEGNELPPGEIGLLYAKHPVMDFEYHGEAEKTASAHSSDGFFTLGDMGYIDGDGWLYLVDRRTDMINSGGVNVYPAEVEDRLVGHDAVLDAAVIGVPDAEWGQRVVAVVAPRDGHAPSDALAQELLAHCQSALARFKCPRTIEFRAELPRLPSGKLARRVLRDELSVPTSGYPQNQEIQR